MTEIGGRPLRVLYSFPDTVGKPGIGTIARHQVQGLAARGVEVELWCTALEGEIAGLAGLVQTLRVAGRRVPHRALGRDRAHRLHDRLAARRVRRAGAAGEIDLVHGWPQGSLATFRAARAAGIATAREVPNTHTAHAFEAVARENAALGLEPPPGHSHAFDRRRLARDEAEYEAAAALLVPSEHAAQTFRERGTDPARLVLHRYGCDPGRFYADDRPAPTTGERGLRAVFVGRCEPRKGLHHALRAWIDSGAAEHGRFLVLGRFVPGYREALGALLEHPSVEVAGYADDVAGALRGADVFVFPSVEEGTALVTYEAQSCGCVLAVSDAAGARAEHGRHALIHAAGDVETLTEHLRALDEDRDLLARLRAATLAHAGRLTWAAAAEELEAIYRRLLQAPDGP